MKIKFILLSVLVGPLLLACASAKKSEPPPIQVQTQTSPALKGELKKIDVEGLKRSLGLDRSRGDLGYEEKRFNTCSAGFGYSKDSCRELIFVSINFRLQCRDTTGTTSETVTSANMEPIANKQVRWQIGKTQSTSITDQEGYGQINGVFGASAAPRGQRLRLAVGGHFVYTRAGEITRIVTPSNWCSGN